MSVWLSEEEYRLVRASVPIACVDVVAVRFGMGRRIESIGLILRDTPHQGRRWCLVGGRVLRDETLAEAVSRHLHQTLGNRVTFHLGPDVQPVYVSQYFTSLREIGVVDPRQHSIAMNYVLELTGPTRAGGEAHEFRWFSPEDVPREQFGFQQDRVLDECLRRFNTSE